MRQAGRKRATVRECTVRFAGVTSRGAGRARGRPIAVGSGERCADVLVLRIVSLTDVEVVNLPSWLRWRRLLGPGSWVVDAMPTHVGSERPTPDAHARLRCRALLERSAAAELAARLRGVAFDGQPVRVDCRPSLPRTAVRHGRLLEARARRMASPGFARRGVRLDDEGRYSLTPEALALAIGRLARGARVVEAGAGVGGNTIGFARAGCRVHAIERDAGRAAMTRHNVGLYGVGDRVTVECVDAFDRVPELVGELLFIDPPWGRDYDSTRVTLDALPLLAGLLERVSHFEKIWAKVPASFDTSTLPMARPIACFGSAAGDRRRVKFVLLTLSGRDLATAR